VKRSERRRDGQETRREFIDGMTTRAVRLSKRLELRRTNALLGYGTLLASATAGLICYGTSAIATIASTILVALGAFRS